jgi:hypothetical protein
VKTTKQPLRVQVTLAPKPDALRSWNSALDLLADWLAADILERARAEAAAELGVTPTEIAPDPNDVAAAVRAHGDSLVGGAS